MDQVFAGRQVCERYLTKGKNMFQAFMDLEKPCDRTDKDRLWTVLRVYGTGSRLFNEIKKHLCK